MTASSHEITRLLDEWNNGDKSAFDELIQLVYVELRQMAHRFMNREKPCMPPLWAKAERPT